jgi:hypothetical protein
MTMPNYLASLASRMDEEDAAVILWEVDEALEELKARDPARYTAKLKSLHNLVRFSKFDSLAPWLRDERDVLRQVIEFARKIDAHDVATILDDALAGKPQGEVSFSVKLPGNVTKVLEVDVGEATKFDGKDWGGTDVALSFIMDDFMAAVVRELVAASDEIDIPPPGKVQTRASDDAKVGAEIAQGQSAVDLFCRLVGAKTPRMAAGSWDDFEARDTCRAQVLNIDHVANSPASPNALKNAKDKYGPIVNDLLAIHAVHDGAELFRYMGECGFYFVPIAEWDEYLARAVEWAEDVTWQDDKDEIPRHLYSAIAFGYQPGDSERWLLITEGDHAGKIMLSDSDLPEDTPRFESLAEFVGTLIFDAARVLNSGGYIRYQYKGDELFPIRYLEQ